MQNNLIWPESKSKSFNCKYDYHILNLKPSDNIKIEYIFLMMERHINSIMFGNIMPNMYRNTSKVFLSVKCFAMAGLSLFFFLVLY